MIQFSQDMSTELREALTKVLYQDPVDTVIAESFSPQSQFDLLLQMSPLPPARVILLALDGLGFHGQYNRPWKCGKGNIYLCMKLETNNVMPAEAWPRLLDVAPTAIINTVAPHIVDRCTRKPINDVMIEGKKSAGALTHCRNEQNRFCAFFGIGLNVQFAPECDQPTTCVADHCLPGTDIDQLWFTLLHDLVHQLTVTFQDFASQCQSNAVSQSQ